MSHPDADLHPVATGLAKKTVDEHSAEQPLKLYAGWFCPFVQRAWITLEEKKIPYQYIEVNPYHKPASLMRANPRGLVPTLEVGPGKSLYESTVLCEYLEERYAGLAPNILPPPSSSSSSASFPGDGDQDYQRARHRIWADFVGSRVIPAFHRFLQFQPKEAGGEERLAELRCEFRGTLREFAAEMRRNDGEEGAETGTEKGCPFFLGGQIGLADIALVPWAVRLWVLDEFKGGVGIPEPGQGGEDEEVWARWRTWLDAMENRDSIKNTTSDREHYVPIYKRYADNTAQSELAKATRAGRGVP
ncbi:hypothetical protein SLS62_003659 [Diatrype stigma]|uniref:Glutathione S-transferase n=1 Tax=Diatrype stigma TaxID=117547 RepID=A0AAN9UVQ4_9PEZI